MAPGTLGLTGREAGYWQAMSQENVELLSRAYAAFNEGDPSVFLERYDADIVLWVSPSSPERGCFLGRQAV